MSFVEAVVLRTPHDVERRLIELELGSRTRLLSVVAVAVSAGADATSFFPANAAGTLAYQHGTAALREEFIGEDWSLDRADGVEAIRNDSVKIKVIFSNVDTACDDDQKPKPRSRKGAGSERACIGNLFGSLPEYAPREPEGLATYYLMVDERGAAELTRPVVRNGTFVAYVERIFLSDGNDLDVSALDFDDSDVVSDFDPQVVRKK
ncbi:MAG: hypothetical protein IKE60_33900 [Reyranella sp.]|uniref:hypothetical protein n=1 Tax=Reyranella sp. TaxID=1929291 RepID=UPI0025E81086|nr:hypothetical protein [Reyranella sp.]MBR2819713.1 hypothetical protein [Reyranella sp.]